MRILIVEDDQKAVAFLKEGLREDDFAVDVVGTGPNGDVLAASGNYDAILLDITLPLRDGWAVLRNLRERGSRTLVLFLTARDLANDRGCGLDVDAKDYLAKSFALSELLAGVRTVLQRGPVCQSEVLRVADLELDPQKHRVTRQGRRIEVTPKEFLLLSQLMRCTGEVLDRAFIAEQVWGTNFDKGSNIIDVHVGQLRRKIDEPFEPKLLHTVRGVGYVLELRG